MFCYFRIIFIFFKGIFYIDSCFFIFTNFIKDPTLVHDIVLSGLGIVNLFWILTLFFQQPLQARGDYLGIKTEISHLTEIGHLTHAINEVRHRFDGTLVWNRLSRGDRVYHRDVVYVSKGSEAVITPLGITGFTAMKALSTRNDEPEKASRPFDKERDGFVMGEGSGVLIIEEPEHALNRGARIYGELMGYGLNSDAYHITSPSPNGEGASTCMESALKDAGINREEVDYINAHGTSTKYGDEIETTAIKNVFGEHAYKLCVSSTKSMIGHLLGASGGVEAAICALSIHNKVVPPTINLDNPDTECDLDYVPHKARALDLNIAMSNSFGFGGTNACIILRRFGKS